MALVDNDELVLYDARSNGAFATGTPVPRDRWICLELRVDLSSAAGAIQLDLDGIRLAFGTVQSTMPPSGVARAELGIVYSANLPAGATVYVDDAVVAAGPIGCT
jgi:hypothetical protein